jgi:hypothetical protein
MLDFLEDSVSLPINCWVIKFSTFESRAHKGDGYFVVFRVLLSKDRDIGTIRGKSVKCEVLREIRAHEKRSIDYGLIYIIERLVFSRSPVI